MGSLGFPKLLTTILVITLFSTALTKVDCLDFSFPTFQDNVDHQHLHLQNSRIFNSVIHVTPDINNSTRILNQSGRSMYKRSFRLWRKGEGNQQNIMASFNSTFALRINSPSGNYPLGEGLAFIITQNFTLPNDSQGRWLGILNDNTNGSSKAGVVAVEFDTRKSFPEDIDDNHVGLDVNSVHSIKQVSLTDYGVNISSNTEIPVQILYDEKSISVFVKDMTSPILTWPLNLSDYLLEEVYIGFSGSTGENSAELNCIRSWHFHSTNIDENPNLLWVWIVIPIVGILLIGVAFFVYWRRPSCKEDLEEAHPGIEDQIQGSSMAPKKFQLKELRRATSDFNLKNKLGKGGFGTVYKGVIGDKVVAVKRISKNSRQGKQEFIAEVTTIASLSHRNLVKLIGWCYENHELLIVYEFMPNGSLDKFIFRNEKLRTEIPELSWERRRIIVFGVAQALDYLHNGCEKKVLHRDIKSSNIMLDSEFSAKVGDFGLARTIQQSEKTHHSTTGIAGTPGYMAPESFLTGRATVETDVYAFGVLMLEVTSGRKPRNQNEENNFMNSTVLWIWGLYSKGMILDAVDSRLNEFKDDEVRRTLVLGLACCHPSPHERPSMRTILKVLIGEEDPPMVPVEIPAFVWPLIPLSFEEDGETTKQGSHPTSLITEIIGR